MQIPYNGKMTEGDTIDFLTRKEDFNEYQLADGKIIRMKTVVTRILRLKDEKQQDGSPVYFIQSQNVVAPVE